VGGLVSTDRRALIDAADRRVLAQVLAVLVVIVLIALALGLAVRAFLWASGLGG
jgi:hypothetical protein